MKKSKILNNTPLPHKHPLRTYMVKHQIPMSTMSEYLGVCRQTIWRWFSYQTEPTISTALKVYQLTNGKLKPKELCASLIFEETYMDLNNIEGDIVDRNPDIDLL